MAAFITRLRAEQLDCDRFWTLAGHLAYYSDIIGPVDVPEGFETDFASVPRIPVFFFLFGDRSHHESVLHDYLYRADCYPFVTRRQADRVFLEAMMVRQKPRHIRWPMFSGVRLFGGHAWHRHFVEDRL